MSLSEELTAVKTAAGDLAAEMSDCRSDLEAVESDIEEALSYTSAEDWSKAKWYVDSATRNAQSVQESAATPMQSSGVKTRLVEPLSDLSDELHQKDREETTIDGRENIF